MNICVFCGSSTGKDSVYAEATKELGQLISKNNCTLVYGGGNIGLMGILADEVLATKGKVIGVIPDFLMKREVGHKGITQLEIVESMHERKKKWPIYLMLSLHCLEAWVRSMNWLKSSLGNN